MIDNFSHGFMSSRSAISNFTLFSQYLCQYLDNKQQVDAVYTNFSKALDEISRQYRLLKLSNMGVNDCYQALTKSYLYQRQQFVHYTSYSSQIYLARSDVHKD